MRQPGLDDRHRDKNGEISRKHGNESISRLRQTYGQNFAPGLDGNVRLNEVLHSLDEPSLSQMVRILNNNPKPLSPFEKFYAHNESKKLADKD
ncbi:MAG: hypothetical protein QOF22_151 [Bradyrhizobium sp.]|jgi:hypothetical protein|nr:hypothetical protein [Bradyrhizobium sp.]